MCHTNKFILSIRLPQLGPWHTWVVIFLEHWINMLSVKIIPYFFYERTYYENDCKTFFPLDGFMMKALQNPWHEIYKYFAKNWGTLTGYRHHCIKVTITEHEKVYLRISFIVQQSLALLSSSLCHDTQNKPYLHDSYGLQFHLHLQFCARSGSVVL
jgi:hypothetical protein